jgi:ankyrin repeat protein
MKTIARGQESCAEVLLDAGADASAKNRSGDTALIVAVANGHADCARLLEAAGRKKKGKSPHEDSVAFSR